MKKTALSILVMALTLTSAAQARGGGSGVLFDVNLYYGSNKTETKNTNSANSTTNSDSTTAIYDIKLGYLSGSGLYFGGIYTSRSNSLLNQSGTAGSDYGASLGYFGASGLFIMGHYIASAKNDVYDNGTGAQVDLGYKAGVGGDWLLGGEITYRSIGYKKSSSNAALDTYTVTEVFPMLSLGYLF
jgi:hypothetical protein